MTPPPAPASDARRPRLGPLPLALTAIVSVQFGNALAGTTFAEVGALGAASLRLLLAAAILLIVLRPSVRGWSRRVWAGVLALGVGLAGMNALIYLAIERVPIGVAVAVELIGPLAVAVAGARRARDLLWVALAAVGVGMLAVDSDGAIGLLGLVLAGGAAAFWALYIVASARLGATSVRGVDGLAVAMVVAAVIVVPLGAAPAAAAVVADPWLIAAFAGIAVMTSALPYALEFIALKSMPTRLFGVLSSLGPVVAALAGLIVLGQLLTPLQLAAIVVIIAASAGAVRSASRS
ncbi:EamA family transporter [Microcella alkalica]|uniref:EamA family transporter n=1 Tax=Microcella alkalica TaxID=355930 RepID=UPI00145F7977|nr:EamA family transporter [Microcella alkalica]